MITLFIYQITHKASTKTCSFWFNVKPLISLTCKQFVCFLRCIFASWGTLFLFVRCGCIDCWEAEGPALFIIVVEPARAVLSWYTLFWTCALYNCLSSYLGYSNSWYTVNLHGRLKKSNVLLTLIDSRYSKKKVIKYVTLFFGSTV